ncbi:class I adenylate-forming enzyme family protein [Bordetella sp. BOR01]|uniref:class I adenylate-forming enzyme family protein n=1 Tax=Bordetella sp. BOR01 TaxID=2854779 RepID=UPI001C43EFD4|nr:AMP-binding protein [Bordetella sp. BOR01]MBV7486549.1 AMP-binding protein [Bordetella sp. BOR01]
MLTIKTLFEQTVAKYPDRLALAYQDRQWTYAQWSDRVRRLAQGYADLGIRPSDRVAIFMKTSEATATAYLACQLLGAVAVPMNFRLSAGEAAYILRDSGARALVYDESVRPLVEQAGATLPALGLYIQSDADAAADVPADGRHWAMQALIDASPERPEARQAPAADDIAALVYTSGTTGRPKGVIHTHANDVAIAGNCIMEYGLTRHDVALHIAPLYHVGGMQAYFMPHLAVGAANIILPRWDALDTLRVIERRRITTLFAVPTQIQDMLFHPQFKRIDTRSLRMITTGGAAIPAATMARVIAELCPNIYNGYGMTEASLTLLLHPADALSRLGSCGKPTLISSCRVLRHRDSGPLGPDDLAEPGEIGQLAVQGPQMTRGYWNNPTETGKKLHDGWLYTGDLFSVDEAGYFHFHGRVDDMIVSGGENIYPREIEEVLYRCPGIQEAAVIGMPDARWGQAVTAFVVRSDPVLTAEAIQEFCRHSNELASYKRPRAVVFVERLPVNPSGKVLRRDLPALAAAAPPANA